MLTPTSSSTSLLSPESSGKAALSPDTGSESLRRELQEARAQLSQVSVLLIDEILDSHIG
jgi:hypothetical protein